jgi:thiol-disulfide isomerase/thioredoxin
MKASALALFAGVALTSTALARTESPRAATAPAIDLPTVDGRIKPADLAGKLVYVDFWASWCGPCQASFPWLKAMHEQYAAKGLVIVAVNVDKDRSDANRFVAKFGPPFVVAYDPAGTTADAFRVDGMPESFLIGPDGTIVYSHRGFVLKDAPKIEAEIKKALGQ